jgi:hypothetical protein
LAEALMNMGAIDEGKASSTMEGVPDDVSPFKNP